MWGWYLVRTYRTAAHSWIFAYQVPATWYQVPGTRYEVTRQQQQLAAADSSTGNIRTPGSHSSYNIVQAAVLALLE